MNTPQANETILYQPDERPSHPASFAHGFQYIVSRLATIAAVTSIVALAGGQPETYVSWILFGALVVCGLGTMFQTVRVWRFGSRYPLSVVSGSPFIAICISALVDGGPAMLSTLIVVSALIQLAFISRLSLLRRIITPVVVGTVLMLLAATTISVVLSRLSDIPEGVPSITAPILAGTTLLVLMGLRLFASPKWQQWGPITGILGGLRRSNSAGSI